VANLKIFFGQCMEPILIHYLSPLSFEIAPFDRPNVWHNWRQMLEKKDIWPACKGLNRAALPKVQYIILRGEILRPLRGSVSQIIVFRYKEIRGILCRKHLRNGIVTSWSIFIKDWTFSDLSYTIYQRFMRREHYGLRNTSC
jgi:hypothetical protein